MIMKKILVVLAFVLIGTMSYAQWSAGVAPYKMYNTNGDFVGISNVAAGFVPTEMLHVRNTANQAAVLMERPWAIAGGNATIGAIRLFNSTSGDYFNFSFRYRATATPPGHEIIQSAYDAGAAQFREFSYFNFISRKYEIRNGVGVAEFQNSGDVFFNNVGGVGVGLTGKVMGSGVKFQVAGKVKCQEVEVAVTPWPDHVFKTGFNLMSLDQVEAFINTNKHLPNVPSEEEVAANGVNLGQMNATLLQKVEELTLYMIQLKKDNDALKARVSNLEK